MVKSSNKLFSSDSWKTWVFFRIPPRTLLYSSSTGRAHNWIRFAMSACSSALVSQTPWVARSLFSYRPGQNHPHQRRKTSLLDNFNAVTMVNSKYTAESWPQLLWFVLSRCWDVTTFVFSCITFCSCCSSDCRIISSTRSSVAFTLETLFLNASNHLRFKCQQISPSTVCECSGLPRTLVAFTLLDLSSFVLSSNFHISHFATLNILWLTLDALYPHPTQRLETVRSSSCALQQNQVRFQIPCSVSPRVSCPFLVLWPCHLVNIVGLLLVLLKHFPVLTDDLNFVVWLDCFVRCGFFRRLVVRLTSAESCSSTPFWNCCDLRRRLSEKIWCHPQPHQCWNNCFRDNWKTCEAISSV